MDLIDNELDDVSGKWGRGRGSSGRWRIEIGEENGFVFVVGILVMHESL